MNLNLNKIAYRISNIEDYGKFIAFCINKDITVWRTYWDEQEKGDRCYYIDWKEKRCFYSPEWFYVDKCCTIINPTFSINSVGDYYIDYTNEVTSV